MLILLLVLGSLALFVLLAVFAISLWVAHDLTSVKRLPLWGHPSELGLVYEDITFPSRGDRVLLRGWYLPSQTDRQCIILIQGEEHHRNSPGIRALDFGRDLVQQGFSALLFDFRGRGESDGGRSSAGDRERWDLLGAIDYVGSRGTPPERIGLLGFSLGAAIALSVAAAESRIPAVVSDSAFLDSMADLRRVPFQSISLPSWFAIPIVLVGRLFFGSDFSKVRPIKEVAKIAPRPIFFIHGKDDHVIPYQETEELFKASVGKDNRIWIVPGARHVRSYSVKPQEYVAKVVEFFRPPLG